MGDLEPELLGFERPVEAHDEMIDIDWFGDIVVGSGLHRFDRGGDLPIGGDHDDDGLLLDLLDLLEYVHTAYAGKLKVQDDRLGCLLGEEVQGPLAAGDGGDYMAFVFEGPRNEMSDGILIIDHHYACHAYLRIGISMTNEVPPPGGVSILMLPPCSSTIL